ncbi:membrane dipeptidase [Streptomyces antimicrobicus]|uniref:Dipeptidase n=1 Tax=Streptomyces antimicrobicus TaxID=2883108 RepID=A0ABS8B3B7_9ACTN|nr:membrane dipeptidase [Streptomyces antimicrobicus]MCB5179096.1 dipeptidase [Streptomyces antimicrobicus]
MADLQDESEAGPCVGAPESPAPVVADALERAAALLAEHPVADGCNTLVWTLRQTPYHDTDTDIPRLRSGAVGAQFWSLLTPTTGDRVVADTLELIDIAHDLVHAYPDELLLALTAGDLADARNRGRIASFLGPVSGSTLTDSLGTLHAFHKLGVRSLAPAGATWAQDDLTPFGHEVVREANRLAMGLDLTGCPPEAAVQIAGASRAPVLISHTGAAALTRHPLNVPDEVLLAVRATGGVCMVSFSAEQTGDSLHAVADHLDHIRGVAGPQSVGLGACFGSDPPHGHPTGLTDPSGYPRLFAELLDRGWPEPDLALLAWDNVARVLRDVEFTSRAAHHRKP